MQGNNEEIDDRGFQSIMDKCTALYGEDEGTFWGVKVPYALGGPDPLDQIAIFKTENLYHLFLHYSPASFYLLKKSNSKQKTNV